jgi:hypothetical protein
LENEVLKKHKYLIEGGMLKFSMYRYALLMKYWGHWEALVKEIRRSLVRLIANIEIFQEKDRILNEKYKVLIGATGEDIEHFNEDDRLVQETLESLPFSPMI